MNNHKFNKQVFDHCDKKARTVIKQYLKTIGFQNFEDGTQYGVDLIDDNTKIAIELEHREPFTESFPFPTYHFLQRKAHYYLTPNQYKVWFFVLNKDFSKLLAISPERILPHLTPANLVTLRCRNSYNDSFYDVPIEQFTLKDIKLN